MLADKSSDTPPTPESTRDTPAPPARTVPSDELFQGRHELLIDHHGEIYRLRLTKTGKLILNK